jgi:hypothetical protein
MSESANRRWVLAMLSSVARDVKFLAWWLIPSAIMPWPSVLRGLFSHLWVGRLEGSRTAASLSSVDKRVAVASVQHRARVVVIERVTEDCNSPGSLRVRGRSANRKDEITRKLSL